MTSLFFPNELNLSFILRDVYLPTDGKTHAVMMWDTWAFHESFELRTSERWPVCSPSSSSPLLSFLSKQSFTRLPRLALNS